MYKSIRQQIQQRTHINNSLFIKNREHQIQNMQEFFLNIIRTQLQHLLINRTTQPQLIKLNKILTFFQTIRQNNNNNLQTTLQNTHIDIPILILKLFTH